MYYVEFFRRRPGVALEDFLAGTVPLFREWSRREAEDELVACLARTWRLGPDEHLLVWRCERFERLDEWDRIFRSGEADDLERPILEVLETYAAGFYRELVPHERALAEGIFYLETFVPWEAAREVFLRRAEATGTRLVLLAERIGLLGPEPGGLALFELGGLSWIERFAEGVPAAAIAAGTYVPLGRQVL